MSKDESFEEYWKRHSEVVKKMVEAEGKEPYSFELADITIEDADGNKVTFNQVPPELPITLHMTQEQKNRIIEELHNAPMQPMILNYDPQTFAAPDFSTYRPPFETIKWDPNKWNVVAYSELEGYIKLERKGEPE